jgi:hypothetical protein
MRAEATFGSEIHRAHVDTEVAAEFVGYPLAPGTASFAADRLLSGRDVSALVA